MAKELGMVPRGLIKNIPAKSQLWKAPVKEWVRECYAKRFGDKLPAGSLAAERQPKETEQRKPVQPPRHKRPGQAAIDTLADLPFYARRGFNMVVGNRLAKRETQLPDAEIYAILRAADDIIARGGRSLLAKILKGSRDRKLLELGLQTCPAYGYFNSLTIEAITEKIDWMIHRDLLEIEYSGKLPMIV